MILITIIAIIYLAAFATNYKNKSFQKTVCLRTPVMSDYEFHKKEQSLKQSKNLLSLCGKALIGLSIFATALCLYLNCYTIKPGEVGVVVDLLGENRGVEDKELTVGMHLVSPWKDVYRFPIFEQNYQWDGEDGFKFQTSEGLSVHADIGITFHLEQDKIHLLFCKYRRGMEEITDLFIKNTIRDAVNRVASHMLIEDLYGNKKEQFFTEVHSMVQKSLKPIGFHISNIFVIGKFVVPDLVMEALNKKIEATQRAQQRENELREAEAQARKDMALADGVGKSKVISALASAKSLMIEARSKADANAMLNQSLTKDLLKWQAINKWDGVMPKAMGGEDMSFLIDLKKE